jgi:RNA polymerase sigma factor (sigma-70 family)
VRLTIDPHAITHPCRTGDELSIDAQIYGNGQHPSSGTETDSTGEAVKTIQQVHALRQSLGILTAGEREAIETAFFMELSYPEVASRLNHPLGTVKTRIRSGLEKLRQALSGVAERGATTLRQASMRE